MIKTIIPSFFPPRKSGLSRGVSIRAIYNGDAMQGRASAPSRFSNCAGFPIEGDRARPHGGRQKGGPKPAPQMPGEYRCELVNPPQPSGGCP